MNKFLERAKQLPRYVGYLALAGIAVVVAGILDKTEKNNAEYSTNNSSDDDTNQIIPRAHASGSTIGGDSTDGGGGDGGGGDGSGSGGASIAGSAGAGSSASACFPAYQMVHTPAGKIPISSITSGMRVVAYNIQEGKFTTAYVKELIVHDGVKYNRNDFELSPLVEVNVKTSHGYETTTVTADHRYYDFENGEYKVIARFKPGDLILTHDGKGEIVEIKQIETSSLGAKEPILYDLQLLNEEAYVIEGGVVHHHDETYRIDISSLRNKFIEEYKNTVAQIS